MPKEQQRQHLKSNNIISKLAVIVLSIVLLTGISLLPTIQVGVYGQVQQQPDPNWINQTGLADPPPEEQERPANNAGSIRQGYTYTTTSSINSISMNLETVDSPLSLVVNE